MTWLWHAEFCVYSGQDLHYLLNRLQDKAESAAVIISVTWNDRDSCFTVVWKEPDRR